MLSVPLPSGNQWYTRRTGKWSGWIIHWQYKLQQEAREWYLEHCKERPTSWLHGQQRKKKEKPIENMLKNKIIPSKESTQFWR